MPVEACAAPVPCTPLEVLLILDEIDADAFGQKLKRKLCALEAHAGLVRDYAMSHALAGIKPAAAAMS